MDRSVCWEQMTKEGTCRRLRHQIGSRESGITQQNSRFSTVLVKISSMVDDDDDRDRDREFMGSSHS